MCGDLSVDLVLKFIGQMRNLLFFYGKLDHGNRHILRDFDCFYLLLNYGNDVTTCYNTDTIK